MLVFTTGMDMFSVFVLMRIRWQDFHLVRFDLVQMSTNDLVFGMHHLVTLYEDDRRSARFCRIPTCCIHVQSVHALGNDDCERCSDDETCAEHGDIPHFVLKVVGRLSPRECVRRLTSEKVNASGTRPDR